MPLALAITVALALAAVLGFGVTALFGVEVLLSVTVEVALASAAAGLAWRHQADIGRQGWLATALAHTWRGALALWLAGVLVGAGGRPLLPQADRCRRRSCKPSHAATSGMRQMRTRRMYATWTMVDEPRLLRVGVPNFTGPNMVASSCRPIGIDLFAGAGGMSLGFEQAGFDNAAVEIDPVHCATHSFNFPHTATICASVVDLSGDDIRRRASLGKQEIDVVFGGAPCQGFSLIGKRLLEDPRNLLVMQFVRLVQELQPRYCVFENVKGLTLGKHARFLTELIEVST